MMFQFHNEFGRNFNFENEKSYFLLKLVKLLFTEKQWPTL